MEAAGGVGVVEVEVDPIIAAEDLSLAVKKSRRAAAEIPASANCRRRSRAVSLEEREDGGAESGRRAAETNGRIEEDREKGERKKKAVREVFFSIFFSIFLYVMKFL